MSGVVEERTKYGRPIVAPSSSRMSDVGAVGESGFQSPEGVIGSWRSAANKSKACSDT